MQRISLKWRTQTLEQVCLYSKHPAKNSRVSIMPWCNHSFHNAVLPAAGHKGRPCWGILGVSACWYLGRETERQIRIISSRIGTEQLHMLNALPYIEYAFWSSSCQPSFLVHVFLLFLPVHVIMCLKFFFYHAMEFLFQSLKSYKRATLPSGGWI